MEKEKKIVVDHKIKTIIKKEKEFGGLGLGSYPTIRKALAGDVSTPQMIKIRAAAIELGGMIKEQKNEIL